ncbi:hypothetical protein [Halanaerobium sp. ST460_2HS_T2]|uniref:hypothetical protein n=1 Tax=Halanaerobium sp. ST460_2HS_T2 TaxID=2183914 RepID=UPI000E02CF63|nr:hypothetical protein [Halanaerobium sp. ST460_2HS_T2]RCW62478.1 AGZA family xanthine/uracil permease-like MFS transporter [Halanaerobium sp. ST460_2HS_T2]
MANKNNSAQSVHSKKGTPLFVKGDLNGFFGLFTNVLTNFLAAIGLLVFAINMPDDIVYGNIVPGTAVAIGLGGIILAYQAKKLSLEEERNNVTAMPYGLSVPHYFVVAFAVMLPVYLNTNDWVLAWSVGMSWNLIQGAIMTIGAFVGPYIQKYVPRAAMLGSLAGLALTFIAMNPIGEVFTTPYIGLLTFAIVIVGWFARQKFPGNIPAGLMAIIIGTVVAWLSGYMSVAEVQEAVGGFRIAMPKFFLGNLVNGFEYLAPFLPAAIPLAIYDFLESLDNLESAEVAGDVYQTGKAMLVPGLLTLLGAVLGSPFPTILYIGHPGWKEAGARVGYSLATGACILGVALLGLLPLVLTIIPLVALLPILIYIAMVIGSQAFAATEKRHMPALILAFMPFVANFVITQIDNALNAAGVDLAELGTQTLIDAGIPYTGWETLGAGNILVGMMLASIVIFIIDRKFKVASAYSLVTAILSFFGFIHASKISFGSAPMVALGYFLVAVFLYLMEFYNPEKSQA